MTGYPRGPRGPRARMDELTEKQQEGRRNRNKGTSWMRDCVKALRLAGWTQAEIVPSHHRSDIAGVGPVAVECKDTTRWDDILAYIDQARFDAAKRSGAPAGHSCRWSGRKHAAPATRWTA